MHKSTAFRLVTTLERHELVEQHTGRGKYRLGVGVLQLAGATSARLDIVQRSRPVTRRLAVELGETVNLTVLSGHEVLYVDQAAAGAAPQPHNWVGQRIPLRATSNGKVLLAHVSDARFAELTAAVHRPHDGRRVRPQSRGRGRAPGRVRGRGGRAGGRPDRRRRADRGVGRRGRRSR